VPGQDRAAALEMAVLEIPARPLVSPALGSSRAMSKRSFSVGLSCSGVALGVGAGPKALWWASDGTATG